LASKLLVGGDLPVDRLGFGAMRLAIGRGVPDHDTAIAVLRKAVELGVNHLDTAAFYGFGSRWAHELIREALAPYPDDLVIATKVGPVIEDGILPTGAATARQLRGLVQEDLRRLGVERLELVYLRPSGTGPAGGESVRDRVAALEELRREGLIHHIGLSHVDLDQLAEGRGAAPISAVQNKFHLYDRGDTKVLTECEQNGIAYVPYFPLGGGSVPLDGLAEVAARHEATPAQIALAWLLQISPMILAIPGTGSLDHLAENVAAAELELSEDDLTVLTRSAAR
jgi:pyridoxine 4-dehydrogenase